MPQYVEVNGQTVEFPDGMPASEIEGAIKKNMLSIRPKRPDATEGMSTSDKVFAGMGSGMSSAIRAIGGGSLLERFGLPGTKEEADAINADLNKTTSGKIGTALGVGTLAAPVALVPGANTYAGATALGGLTGAALTEGDIGERVKGAAFGAAGGAFGKGVGDVLGWGAGKLLGNRESTRLAAETVNAQKDAALKAAQDAGYVIPPADVRQTVINEMLNGFSGKIKTAQVASQRNQEVTNRLARKAIGVPEDMPLNVQTLNAVRADAGKAYEALSGAGTVNPGKSYTDALDAIVEPYMKASRSFPGAKPSPVIDEINTLRTTSFDAGDAIAKIRSLRADADAAYAAGNKDVGKSLKAGADALEQAIDDHVASFGPSRMLQDFREARTRIAKTYTVQKGLNDSTGDVSAQVLANLLKKGKYLEGDLKTVAQVGNAFPKATQALKEAPKAVSPLDFAVGAITGTTSGNPLMLGAMAARPAVRSALLSQPYQSRMLQNSYAPGLLDSILPGFESEAMQRAMLATGITGGLLTN